MIIDGETVDVKANFNQGQVCIEIRRDTGEDGWLLTSKAKYIYCVCVSTFQIYKYDLAYMRAYVMERRNEWSRTNKNDVVMWVRVTTDFIERLQ